MAKRPDPAVKAIEARDAVLDLRDAYADNNENEDLREELWKLAMRLQDLGETTEADQVVAFSPLDGAAGELHRAREIASKLEGPKRAALRWYGQSFAERAPPRPHRKTVGHLETLGLIAGYLLTAELTSLGRAVLAAIDVARSPWCGRSNAPAETEGDPS